MADGNLSAGDTFKIQPGGTRVFHVQRDLNKSLHLSVKIGDQTESINIPPQQQFVLKTELCYSTRNFACGSSERRQ